MAKPQDKKQEVKKPVEAKAPEAPKAKKTAQIVQVHYTLKNHHFLDHVTHLAPGMNQVMADTWEKAASHPATKQLLKDGHIKIVGNQNSSVKEDAGENDKEE